MRYFIFLSLLIFCYCGKSREKESANGIWIPEVVDWKEGSFDTYYIKGDTVVIISSEQKMIKDSIYISIVTEMVPDIEKIGKGIRDTLIVIDTTVNNALKLLDPASIRQNIGDQRGNFIKDDQATRVQFANKTINEYLILYHLDGSNANTFNEFEIGLLDSKKGSFKTTTYPSFYTENGIRVGMTLDSLIAMKGKKFKRTDQKGSAVLTYRVTDNNVVNHILARYNMPIYEAQYFFQGNRLIKFIFGFPDL